MRRLLLCLLALPGLAAADGGDLYARYAQGNTPYSQAVQADAAAEWLAERGQIDQIALPGSRWNPLDRLAPVTGVADCVMNRVVDHPRANDIDRAVIRDLCAQMKDRDLAAIGRPGRWTGAGQRAVDQLYVAVKVPGESKVIISTQPWQSAAGAARDLDEMLKGQRPPRAK